MIDVGKPIKLQTQFGQIFVRHLGFNGVPMIGSGAKEGVVITTAERPAVPTLVRLQSSCLFGEAFWATDCECAQQLHLAINEIVKANGLLIYMYEEGRGAGLKRKIEAIALQNEMGIETDKAFECLSLESDLRTYRAASEALREVLGPEPEIILLSNNPAKVEGLVSNGIKVTAREKLIPRKLSENVKRYLRQKRERLGHIIDEADLL